MILFVDHQTNALSTIDHQGLPRVVRVEDALQPAFVAEQCEVWTSDASQLASFAATLDVDTTVLPDIISKEPLGPVVADGDTEWAQVVNWATMATIQAWEYGIDSSNVDSFLDSEDSGIRTFLGQEVEDSDGNTAVTEVPLMVSRSGV